MQGGDRLTFDQVEFAKSNSSTAGLAYNVVVVWKC